jgi:hypothetical protein
MGIPASWTHVRWLSEIRAFPGRLAAGKDITPADEPVLAAISDAAQAACGANVVLVYVYSNLLGYSDE